MGLEAHLKGQSDAYWLGTTEAWLSLVRVFEEDKTLRQRNWISGEVKREEVPELHYALSKLNLPQDLAVVRDNLLDALISCYNYGDTLVIV